jgi:hypothetical protein
MRWPKSGHAGPPPPLTASLSKFIYINDKLDIVYLEYTLLSNATKRREVYPPSA